MAIKINGKQYYRTSEVCNRAGISRATLFRWLKIGILPIRLKDRRGWSLFTENDLDLIRSEAKKIVVFGVSEAKQ
jgi:predicted site-specific integrase-resolvase